MATHSSILAREVRGQRGPAGCSPWTEGQAGCSPWGRRAGHDLVTKQQAWFCLVFTRCVNGVTGNTLLTSGV